MTLRLVLGNRVYSSWSLRAWLAAKQSGLAFETKVLSLYGADWAEAQRSDPDLAPSQGRVPVLWDGETPVWDSLAILETFADKAGRDRFWPRADDARALARAMVAEMHSGFGALRNACPMNLRRRAEGHAPFVADDAVHGDLHRVVTLWAEARARFGHGGPFLFGCFGAADIFYAPVAARIAGYGLAVPGFAASYVDALLGCPWMEDYRAAAAAEPWTIPHFEVA